jgi:hypothetical protein
MDKSVTHQRDTEYTGQTAANENHCSAFGGIGFLSINPNRCVVNVLLYGRVCP